MSYNNFNDLIKSFAQSVEDNEKLFLPYLSSKLKKVAEIHPHDSTIISITSFIDKLSNKELFITKKEVKDLYHKFYNNGNKFAQYFKDDLGELSELQGPTFSKEKQEIFDFDSKELTDQKLLNSFNQALKNNFSNYSYDEKLAKKSCEYVSSALDNWGVKPNSTNIENGSDKFIIVRANYNTPKGSTSIMVPVEIKNNKVLHPNIFISNSGPVDINNANIKNHIISNAGVGLKFTSAQVLNVLTKISSEDRDITNAELNIRLKFAKDSSVKTSEAVGLARFIQEQNSLPAIEVPDAESFEKKFTRPDKIAEFKFGKDNVDLGRNLICRKLNEFGFKGPQVSVISSDENGIFYSASLNNGRNIFKIPVKIANNKALTPEVILCNGSILHFNKKSVDNLFFNNETDYKVAASISPQYSLKPKELIENVKNAMHEGNLAKAEDALNVLQQSGEDSAYKTAFGFYINGLTPKTATKESTCSLIVKNSTSKYPICGHTNLPIHKVYQDEFGDCHPHYWKEIDENQKSIVMFDNKVLG